MSRGVGGLEINYIPTHDSKKKQTNKQTNKNEYRPLVRKIKYTLRFLMHDLQTSKAVKLRLPCPRLTVYLFNLRLTWFVRNGCGILFLYQFYLLTSNLFIPLYFKLFKSGRTQASVSPRHRSNKQTNKQTLINGGIPLPILTDAWSGCYLTFEGRFILLISVLFLLSLFLHCMLLI